MDYGALFSASKQAGGWGVPRYPPRFLAEHRIALSPRYIVRPRGILQTPKRLKEVLNARYTVSADRPKRFQEGVDFFLAYPRLDNASPEYRKVRSFCVSDKQDQRDALWAGGLNVPNTYGLQEQNESFPPGPYVVRPLRHRSGQGWRITNVIDHNPRTEYLSVLFPKKYEYRVIYCKGQKVSTLLKRTPDGIDNNVPWNHGNGCFFVTVNNEDNDRLRHTDCYEKLSAHPVVANADLVAADVLLDRRNNYVVCELNFAPGITIQSTLDAIRNIVSERVTA